MPDKVLDKIQFLCKKISSVEWSGVLFYSIKGSIKKPETFKITLEDILPLDKGTTGYTSYKLDDRFVDYLMEDPEVRMDWKVGQIHSHHNMRVYFSGVDMAELNDNCPQHNFYLSLIVNNYNNFVAKVAILGEGIVEKKGIPFNATDENGKSYVMEKLDFKHTEQKMYTYDCDIVSSIKEVIVPEDFSKKVEDLITPPKKEAIADTFQPNIQKLQSQTTHVPAKTASTMTPTVQSTKPMIIKTDRREFMKKFSEDFSFGRHVDLTHEELMEEFALDLFYDKEIPLAEGENLEDVLMDLIETDAKSIAIGISNCYVDIYSANFPGADTDKEFIYYTESLIDFLSSEYMAYEEIINPTIALLRAMIKNFKEYGTTV